MSEGIAPGRHPRQSAPRSGRVCYESESVVAPRPARRAVGQPAKPVLHSAASAPIPPLKSSGSDQCAMPAVKHRIRYQPVTETHTQVCYRPVYHTVMEQECYTCLQAGL